jgi:hypothetical protein
LFCRYVHENEVPFPFERVVSLNITRRHLTTSQKREVIAALLQDMPEMSNRELARKVAVDDKTVGTVRRHLEKLGQLVPQEVTIGRDNRVRTARPRRTAPAEGPETVKVEKDRLVRLAATRYAQDSGDLFTWAKDGLQKIAHVLVQDGCAQASLAKVQQVAQAMLNQAKRLDREARESQRAARGCRRASAPRGAEMNQQQPTALEKIHPSLTALPVAPSDRQAAGAAKSGGHLFL